MINLLPPSLQKEQAQDRLFRMLLSDAIGVGAGFLAFLLLLFAILGYGNSALQTQSLLLGASLEEFQQLGEEEKAIKEANAEIAALQNIYAKMRKPSVLFEQLEKDLPQGVRVNTLAYTPQGEQIGKDGKRAVIPARVALGGYAPTRDTLVQIQRALEDDPFFRTVSIPPSNWVPPVDVEFSIQLELAPDVL